MLHSSNHSLPFSLMAMDPFLPILLSLLSAVTTTAITYQPSIIATSAPLRPDQNNALQTMNIPISTTNPCSDPFAICDTSTPFRHLLSLSLSNCSYPLSISSRPLRSLSTLTTLELINCPFDLKTNSSTPLSLILESLENLTRLTISYSNLNESLPKKWAALRLTHLDLSNNHLEGQIPDSMGELVCLKSLSLASNSLDGDVPSFTVDMKNLKYLNLENNKFKEDNETCTGGENDHIGWSTTAVSGMAIVLSVWIVVIGMVVFLANWSLC